MNAEWKPSDSNNDVIKIFEAHSLIPSDPLFDDALGLVSLYADRIGNALRSSLRQSTVKKLLLLCLKRDSCRKGLFPIVMRDNSKCL